MKILVVEDDQIILEFLSLVLEAEGIDVVPARGGLDAVAAARTERPNAVLCDYHMARFSGLDVLQRLREDPATADTPFVMITADQSPTLRRQCLQGGVTAFVVKPFDPDFLVETLRRVSNTSPAVTTPPASV